MRLKHETEVAPCFSLTLSLAQIMYESFALEYDMH